MCATPAGTDREPLSSFLPWPRAGLSPGADRDGAGVVSGWMHRAQRAAAALGAQSRKAAPALAVGAGAGSVPGDQSFSPDTVPAPPSPVPAGRRALGTSLLSSPGSPAPPPSQLPSTFGSDVVPSPGREGTETIPTGLHHRENRATSLCLLPSAHPCQRRQPRCHRVITIKSERDISQLEANVNVMGEEIKLCTTVLTLPAVHQKRGITGQGRTVHIKEKNFHRYKFMRIHRKNYLFVYAELQY